MREIPLNSTLTQYIVQILLFTTDVSVCCNVPPMQESRHLLRLYLFWRHTPKWQMSPFTMAPTLHSKNDALQLCKHSSLVGFRQHQNKESVIWPYNTIHCNDSCLNPPATCITFPARPWCRSIWFGETQRCLFYDAGHIINCSSLGSSGFGLSFPTSNQTEQKMSFERLMSYISPYELYPWFPRPSIDVVVNHTNTRMASHRETHSQSLDFSFSKHLIHPILYALLSTPNFYPIISLAPALHNIVNKQTKTEEIRKSVETQPSLYLFAAPATL